MKKRLSVFVCLMLAMVMTAGAVFAGVQSGNSDVGRGNFDKTYTGTNSKFVAYGKSSEAYVTLENLATTSRYLSCYVFEITDNIGLTNSNSASMTASQGVQISTTIPRDLNMYGYYQYSGTCKYSEYGGGTIDEYTYKAYQRRTIGE